MALREGSRTPHEGTIEFISLDSHKGAGESQCLPEASKAQLELLLWQCSLQLGLPAGISVTAAFQAFTCTWNQVPICAVSSCLSLGCCVGTCQVTQHLQQEVQGCSSSIWSLGCCRCARSRKQGCSVLA